MRSFITNKGSKHNEALLTLTTLATSSSATVHAVDKTSIRGLKMGRRRYEDERPREEGSTLHLELNAPRQSNRRAGGSSETVVTSLPSVPLKCQGACPHSRQCRCSSAGVTVLHQALLRQRNGQNSSRTSTDLLRLRNWPVIFRWPHNSEEPMLYADHQGAEERSR
jgi:hypothetical protein